MAQPILTEADIASLLAEKKPLPVNWKTRLNLRPKSDLRFTHRDYQVKGENHGIFRIIARQNTLNILDFSIILTFTSQGGNEYRLVRFNGKHPSAHTNKWEHARKLKGTHHFRSTFHIHRATERYQVDGYDIDGFAEETTDYGSFDTALDLFVRSNGFVVEPADPHQLQMFSQS